MRYGFKSQAEKIALAAREALRVDAIDPLDPYAYARYLDIVILDFKELNLSEMAKQQLLERDAESWSGLTLKIENKTTIVVNPVHSEARQANTLMHEISHVTLKHIPTRVDISPSGILLVSEYPEEAEAEADWLAGALLLPRAALMLQRSYGRSTDEIAALYGVSRALCEWRIRMTGVDIQRKRSASR